MCNLSQKEYSVSNSCHCLTNTLRTVALFCSATILLLCGTNTGIGDEKQSTPNIVLIFIDDLGYGDIGPFGNSSLKTPHLDKLAQEGMKFTSFYATPVCSMSRACLMTGCYNTRVSVPGVLFPRSNIGLHANEITLADLAKSKGYATTCIGKWHLGHLEPFLPTKQGFDYYFGIPYSNDMSLDTKHAKFAKDCVFREDMTEAKAREKELRNVVPLMRNEEVVEYPADQSTLTQRYTTEAIKFMRDNKDRPFFLYLPHTMVHFPLAASDHFRGKSSGGLFGDAVEEIDWSVGQIMATLRELNLDNNTLVIFTSDNGAAGGSSAPWRGKKGTTFEGGVREPCIMRWANRIPAGKTCNQIAGNIDILPTFAKLMQAEIPTDRVIDGRDISSLMLHENAPAVRDTHLYFTGGGGLAAIRQNEWKLFLNGTNEGKKGNAKGKKDKGAESGVQLYNLDKDPAEATNVAADNKEIVAKLQTEAKQRLAEIMEHKRPAGQIAAE
jgi:arylsulfatase A